MLDELFRLLPRYEGNAWNVSKSHETPHAADDMDEFGSPMNWDASFGEHLLIYFVKRIAQTALMRRDQDSYMKSVAHRLHERECMLKAARKMGYVSRQRSLVGKVHDVKKTVEELEMLEQLERRTFELGGGQYALPCQRLVARHVEIG